MIEARQIRSALFVPGDSERKLAKVASVGADAVIIDLEDAVVEDNADFARALTAEFLRSHPRDSRSFEIWIRPKPTSHPGCLSDLASVIRYAPDRLLLPKSRSGDDVVLLDHYISAFEARDGIETQSVKIVPILTETPESVIKAWSYPRCSSRLAGFSWGPVDLATALGAATNRAADGNFDSPYLFARAVCLLTARSAGVMPIDTIEANFRDLDLLALKVSEARRSGFTGKLAIHPDQVEVINDGFRPTPEEVDKANRIISAFEGHSRGAIAIDGEMMDLPHLLQARAVVAMASGH